MPLKVNKEKFDKIIANLNNNIDQLIYLTAVRTATDAADAAPIDTGFLVASIHLTSTWFSEYSTSKEKAISIAEYYKQKGRTPKGVKLTDNFGRYIFFPEIKPTTPHTIYICVGAEHGNNIENSIYNRQPFLEQAIYRNRPTFEKNLKKAFSLDRDQLIGTVAMRL